MNHTCRTIEALLPWYANSTLEESEAKRVRQHLASCTECRAVLADTAAVLSELTNHISSETLVELALSPESLPEPVRLEAETHVSICSACSEEADFVRSTTVSPETLETPRIHWSNRFLAAACAVLATGLALPLVLGNLNKESLETPGETPSLVASDRADEPMLDRGGQLFLDGFEGGDAHSWLVIGASAELDSESTQEATEQALDRLPKNRNS